MVIALCVLCGIVLLLCIPLSIAVRWEDGLLVQARWLLLRVRLYPQKEKKEKPKAAKGQKREKQEPEKPAPKPDLQQLAGMAVDAVQSAGAPMRMVLSNLRIRKLVLDVTVAAEDAAQTAISFGKVQACLHTALGTLGHFIKIIRPRLLIRPDFLAEETRFTLSFRAVVTPLIVLAAAIRAGIAFLGRTIRRGGERREQELAQQEKGAPRPANKKECIGQ